MPSDHDSVASLLRSGADVGTAKWGIALSAAEEKELDLPGRMTFVIDANERLLPYVRSLEEYAGAYVVPADGGRLVIMLTSLDPEVSARIQELKPDGPRSVEVGLAKHSWEALTIAAGQARDAWDELSSIESSR